MSNSISIIIPSKNEASGLTNLLPKLNQLYPEADIILIDDGSTDETLSLADKFNVTIVSHPYNIGNGAAVKTGARTANSDILIYMDADGQHNPEDINRLLESIESGADMAVGARSSNSQAGKRRWMGNKLYNTIASLIVGHKIDDLTSGFRAVRATKFREFLHILPNGFSYPTTITMAFFRAGYSIKYIPIVANKRLGKSHLRLGRDGLRFLIIIFKVGTLYSPLKIFFPISFFLFLLGAGYYLYTFIMHGRFTNMSALLFISSLLIILIGLISEQITTLIFKDTHLK